MYVGSAPIITASWPAVNNQAWTLPFGAQVGRVVKIGGKLPINFAVGAYYNAIRPEFGFDLAASYADHVHLLIVERMLRRSTIRRRCRFDAGVEDLVHIGPRC